MNMVKGGKHRKHPICGNCSESVTDYNEDEYGDKIGLKTLENKITMTPVEKYDGNGMAFKCSLCGNTIIEPPLDMLDGELDEEELVDDIVERIEAKKVDKSKVMERAHELREQGMDMSDAMVQAWEEAGDENKEGD